jgi:pterin-4a-carbinolamine dehydratase
MDAPAGWEERDGRLRRRFAFPDYARACTFAGGITRLADEQDHHPTVVHAYREVEVVTWSHDVDAITARDQRLAAAVDLLAAAIEAGEAGGAPGFAVIYRWRLDPAQVESFAAAWAALTRLIARDAGGRGSRLHEGPDGIHLAYAQWPDRAAWEQAQAGEAGLDEEAAAPHRAAMDAAVLESLPAIPLAVLDDLLDIGGTCPGGV